MTLAEKTRTLDPHFDAMLEAAKAIQMPPMAMIPAPMVRELYRTQRAGQDAGAPKDIDVRDLDVAGGDGPLKARLYKPKGAATPGPCLVYFHGGGFVIGDLDTHDDFLRRLSAAAGLRVLHVDYRLAPEHPFPAAHDDALASTRWTFDHASEIGVDPSRIAVGGCSAGGNLAACMAVELKNDPAHQIAFQLLLYPATAMVQETQSRKDLATGYVLTAEIMDWFAGHFAATTHPDGARANPKDADLSGVAPALIITAGFDPLKDEGKAYAAQLKATGVKATHVQYESFVHDFMIMASVSPAVLPAIDETAKALKEALA